MRKGLILIITCLLLVGCNQAINETSIQTQVNKVINETMPASNNYKTYYSYYLPTHVSKVESDSLNSVLKNNAFEIILTVSPAEVIKDLSNVLEEVNAFRTEITVFANLIASVEGEYYEPGRGQVKYSIYINKYNNTKYLINMEVGYAKLTSVVNKSYVLDVLKDMFVIGRSVKTDNQMIMADFQYTEEVIAGSVDFNSNYYPNEGYLNDDLGNNVDYNDYIPDYNEDEFEE